MSTHGLPIDNFSTLILVFSLTPLIVCMLADRAPGEWRYLYKFVLTLIGLIFNILSGFLYLGPNIIDPVNGAYFEFAEIGGGVFFVLAGLYVLPGLLNLYEWYHVHYEREMNTE